MGIGTGSAALIGGLGLVGSIGGAAISSNAASNAASQQASAANNAANLTYQTGQNSLNFQENQYDNSQSELAPFLQSGDEAQSNLDYLIGLNQPSSLSGTATNGTGTPLQTNVAQPNAATGGAPGTTSPGTASGTPGVPTTTNIAPINSTASPNTSLGAAGSLLAPYPGGQFTAPTAAQAEQTPGYQFQLQQGNQALQQSAAARGNLLTGGTAEALDNYSQGLAASNYQNVYNNAYNTYASNYNQYQNQQTGEYNKLAALAGMGQTTASTLGTLGANTANSVANTATNTAGAESSDIQNAAAANASGIVGSGNAWSSALGGSTSNLSQLALMQQLLGSGSGSQPSGSNLQGIINNF